MEIGSLTDQFSDLVHDCQIQKIYEEIDKIKQLGAQLELIEKDLDDRQRNDLVAEMRETHKMIRNLCTIPSKPNSE